MPTYWKPWSVPLAVVLPLAAPVAEAAPLLRCFVKKSSFIRFFINFFAFAGNRLIFDGLGLIPKGLTSSLR